MAATPALKTFARPSGTARSGFPLHSKFVHVMRGHLTAYERSDKVLLRKELSKISNPLGDCDFLINKRGIGVFSPIARIQVKPVRWHTGVNEPIPLELGRPQLPRHFRPGRLLLEKA